MIRRVIGYILLVITLLFIFALMAVSFGVINVLIDILIGGLLVGWIFLLCWLIID